MTAIQSSQDFVRALKSTTDPPFPDSPCKVEIARQVWDRTSFYVPSKAEVITEWILTKLLKDKGKDRDSNPVLDVRYWALLADIICDRDRVIDARPLKTWLSALLARVPIAPIVLSFLGSYTQNDDMSKTAAACLSTIWPLGVQKTATETLLECFGASLRLIKEHGIDEGLVNLVVNSYRNSVSNHSNKKKICNLFLQQHLLPWLELIACTTVDEPLQDSVYNAGVETFFNLDVLRKSHDSKSGDTILDALQDVAESSKNALMIALPRLFSSFLQAVKKYRTTFFGQGSNQLPGAGTNELNAAGMHFFIRCQALLGDDQSSLEAWTARNALLNIVRENNLFNRSLPDAELGVNRIGDLAIDALAGRPSVISPAIECLSTITRIDHDIVLPALPRILPQLLRNHNGDGSTLSLSSSFLGFLDLILDFHTKTRTIPTHVSNLLDIACSPKHIASADSDSDDASQIYQSRSACVLFRPAYLSRLAKTVQTFVTASQTVPLAQTIAERLESAWKGLEKAARHARQGRESDDVHPDILAVRLSLLTALASAVLSALPARTLRSDERTSFLTAVDPLRCSFISKVVGKLCKKLRSHESHKVWGWQICAAAVLRLAYVLDSSRNLGLPQPAECDTGLVEKLTGLTQNEHVLPELGLEAFRYLFSKAAVRDPTETRATVEQALVCLEQRLSYRKSWWSGYPYQLTYGEEGRTNYALALLHMLVERWLPTLDSYATSEQSRRFIERVMTIPLGNVSSPESTKLRPHDVLLMVLRSAHFWELHSIRPVFLSFLTDSTAVLDNLLDVRQAIKAASIYQLVLYVPMEYLTKSSRAMLVKRAFSADVFLSSAACKVDENTGQLITVLRIFLKRVFTHTGHVEPSTLGLAGFLEHLMISQPAKFADQEMCIDTTLDLMVIYFQELCRSAQRGNKDIMNSLKSWTTSAASTRGVARVIDILVADFSLPSFSEEIRTCMRATYAQLISLLLPRMNSLVVHQPTLGAQTDSMTLWTSVLSFGKWLALENEVPLFGGRLASRIVVANDSNASVSLDEARVMTLAMMFQELQCLPEGEQAGQLERVIAVYVSFALVFDDKGRDRLDGYMSRACKSISVSNYTHVLDLVLEALSNHRACPPPVLTQTVYLATRLLKDYPQNTFKHVQTFTMQCVNTFVGHDIFVNGPMELRVRVLDYVVQLSSERPAALRSSDLSGIWQLLGEFLAASRLHDQETSTVIFHRIVSTMGALVRLRRDLVAWTLPHLGMMLRQLILCMRACRPMLGAKQTAMVMDTQPRWISAKNALGVDEAKALSRLLEALGAKTVVRTFTQGEMQKAESLAQHFSKHAIYVVKAYIECMNDPLCVLSAEVRREMQPGLFALCGMVSEHGRDAVMVSALDTGGKMLMKTLWREYEKQKYVGKG